MDLFEKCLKFTRADDAKNAGLYPYFHPIQENEGPIVKIYGKPVIMAGSNNYLGLTANPRVMEAAANAVKKYGTGCSGSRYLTGTLDLHVELEEKLAKFLGYESVLLFSTGFQTATGAIPTLVQKGEWLVSDRENHACIQASGIMVKGGFGEFVRFKHGDIADLERVLSNIPEDDSKLIVTDGVFSVTGEIVNLPELSKMAKKYKARILVDDAHAFGVIGKGGRGTASHFDMINDTDLTMGTFSKSLASLGGFIAGPERVMNYLKHNSLAVIFSASPTPSSCAATLAALQIIEEQPELITKLIHNADIIREAFGDLGFNIIKHPTAIVPVIIGDVEKALLFWRQLFDNGIFVNTFIPPGVPPNMSMMRTSYMASHEESHLQKIIEVFKMVGKNMGLI